MQNLRISLVQSALHWHDPAANLSMFAEKIAPLAGKTDLIILPEMFSTGFTMSPEQVAEPENGPVLQWMQYQALQLNAVLCGSVVVQSDAGYHNRFYWVQPDGEVLYYDKRHLFRMASEHQYYQPGQQRLIIEYKGWRILPQICYDLRFPVWSRNQARESDASVLGGECQGHHEGAEYDLAIYVANWPQVRSHPWKVLLQARAIENLCYVAGVNRVGVDGNDLPYSGDSALIDFKGLTRVGAQPGEETIITSGLDKQALMDFRAAFPAMNDADRFTLI